MALECEMLADHLMNGLTEQILGLLIIFGDLETEEKLTVYFALYTWKAQFLIPFYCDSI